jgi:hypothetical protein
LATGIGREFWLDSTALVAFVGVKAEQCEFGDSSPNSFDGDLEVLNRLLNGAVDRTEEKRSSIAGASKSLHCFAIPPSCQPSEAWPAVWKSG